LNEELRTFRDIMVKNCTVIKFSQGGQYLAAAYQKVKSTHYVINVFDSYTLKLSKLFLHIQTPSLTFIGQLEISTFTHVDKMVSFTTGTLIIMISKEKNIQEQIASSIVSQQVMEMPTQKNLIIT